MLTHVEYLFFVYRFSIFIFYTQCTWVLRFNTERNYWIVWLFIYINYVTRYVKILCIDFYCYVGIISTLKYIIRKSIYMCNVYISVIHSISLIVVDLGGPTVNSLASREGSQWAIIRDRLGSYRNCSFHRESDELTIIRFPRIF